MMQYIEDDVQIYGFDTPKIGYKLEYLILILLNFDSAEFKS